MDSKDNTQKLEMAEVTEANIPREAGISRKESEDLGLRVASLPPCLAGRSRGFSSCHLYSS